MQNISLTAALERATTWSSYLDSMLSGAITLTNAEADPARALECMQQAAHAAAQVANAVSEYLLTIEHLSNAASRQPAGMQSGESFDPTDESKI